MTLIHIINQNSISQFASRFECEADGTIVYYHPDRMQGGIVCTQGEAETMIEEYATRRADIMGKMVYWVIGIGVVLGILDVGGVWSVSHWQQLLIILAPFPLVVTLLYHESQRPMRLLGSRFPSRPPRSHTHLFWKRVGALPPTLFLLMFLSCGGLSYYGWRDGWGELGSSSIGIIIANSLMIAVWLYAKWKK